MTSQGPIQESENLVFEQDEISPEEISFDLEPITNFETTGYGGISAVIEGEMTDLNTDISYPITVQVKGYYQEKDPEVGIMDQGFVASNITVLENPTSLSDLEIEEKLEDYEFEFGGLGESLQSIAQPLFSNAVKARKEKLVGGKADGKDPKDFNSKELRKGFEIEMEHTKDPDVSLEITMDHLAEFPDYYTRLVAMEREAGSEQ